MGKEMVGFTDRHIVTALHLLTEEGCEVGQVVQKIHRFGFTAYNPDDELKTTNRELLEREAGDFLYIVELLVNQGVLRPEKLADAMFAKHGKLKRFTSIPHDELPAPCTILLANPPSGQVVPSSTMHSKIRHIHEVCKRHDLSMQIAMRDDDKAQVNIFDTTRNNLFVAPYLEEALDMVIDRFRQEGVR